MYHSIRPLFQEIQQGGSKNGASYPQGCIISILRVVIFRDCLGIIDILHVYDLGVVSEV